ATTALSATVEIVYHAEPALTEGLEAANASKPNHATPQSERIDRIEAESENGGADAIASAAVLSADRIDESSIAAISSNAAPPPRAGGTWKSRRGNSNLAPDDGQATPTASSDSSAAGSSDLQRPIALGVVASSAAASAIEETAGDATRAYFAIDEK